MSKRLGAEVRDTVQHGPTSREPGMGTYPRSNSMRERTVKTKIKRLLDTYGWFWFMPNTHGYGRSGVSDFCALKDGVFLAIESKFARSKATALQIGFLNSISMESGFGLIVNEDLMGDLEFFLKHFDLAVRHVRANEGETPSADIGGPLVDALRRLTDYPKSMEEYAHRRHMRQPEPDEADADA